MFGLVPSEKSHLVGSDLVTKLDEACLSSYTIHNFKLFSFFEQKMPTSNARALCRALLHLLIVCTKYYMFGLA